MSDLEALAAGADMAAAGEESAPLPGMVETRKEQEAAEEGSALAVSVMAVNFVADAVETGFKCLRYGPETRREGAEKIAPLLLKYGVSGGVLGEWLERWKEEIAAGMFFGGVIWASVKAVREYNAEAEAAEKPSNVTNITGDGISGD